MTTGLPRACGALGDYEPERVHRIAAAFNADLSVIHEEPGSLLMLDREPLRWEGPDGRGLGWSQGLAPAGPIRSWRDAACAAGACGLALDRGRVVVHTDVSGIGPVYYTSVGRAVYFATRIDPLVQAATELLHADWEAWAAILAINLPLGDRTPFAEIKRLGPFATLAGDATAPEVRAEPWPWAQQDAPHDLDAGTPDVVAALRAAVDRLPRGPVALPLTGGGDSRALLCLMRGDPDRPPRCITTTRDIGNWQEEELAGAVARAAGVRYETIDSEPELWWDDVRRHAFLTDYQFVARPWTLPMARRLVGWEERPVLDGLALDTWSQPAAKYIPREAVLAPTAREAGLALWRSLRRFYARPPLVPYKPALRRALRAACEPQMLAVAESVGESPSRALLTFYLARTRRGVSLLPTSLLGADLEMVTLFTDDEVVRACLAIDPRAKVATGMHPALLRALDPELAELPSTNDPQPPWPQVRPLRQRTPEAIHGWRTILGSGPLAPLLRRSVWEDLDRGRPPSGALRVAIFHLWEERYRDKLAPVDPVAGFGL